MDQEQASRSSGYLSEASKKKFTLVAGVLGALCFVLQFAAPMVGVFAMMPATVFSHRIVTYALEGSALYRGEIHLVEKSEGFEDLNAKSSRTRLVKIGRSGVQEVAPLEGWEPRLLADAERLWLVSSTRMAAFDGARVQALEVQEPLGDVSRPFLLDGAPSLVERRPDGERLVAWREGAWTEVRRFSGDVAACCAQLLAIDSRILVLRESGRSLFSRELDREDQEWAVVASSGHHWYAFTMDGKPAVVSSGGEGFRIVRLEGQRWIEVASGEGGGRLPAEVAAFQARPGAPLTVASTGFPGSLKVRTWDGARFVDERRIASFSPFPRGMLWAMWLPQVGSMLMSLVLAVILSSLMRVHRIGGYVREGTQVQHASLTRRALSQLVDSMIQAGPAIVAFYRMFGDFEQMFSDPSWGPFRFFALMAGALAWAFLTLVAFSASEGLWGVTPGKWLTGIRVIGTDLTPCGFGRALIRNILKFVDGFFNFLVGMLMVAYTPDWQRLGDLAARTIVVRTPPGGLRALRPATSG